MYAPLVIIEASLRILEASLPYPASAQAPIPYLAPRPWRPGDESITGQVGIRFTPGKPHRWKISLS
jgi:hypothetical protein